MARYLKIFLTTFQLKCPACHGSPLYSSYFQVHHRCPNCDQILDREGDVGGPFVISYLVSALVTILFFFIVYSNDLLSGTALSLSTAGFAFSFIFLFGRYAKSMWVTFLYETKTLEEYEVLEQKEKELKS